MISSRERIRARGDLSREGREEYDYEISRELYDRLGSFRDDCENERLIRTGKRAYSFENAMYGSLGPEGVVWDEEAHTAMQQSTRERKK